MIFDGIWVRVSHFKRVPLVLSCVPIVSLHQVLNDMNKMKRLSFVTRLYLLRPKVPCR